MAFNTLLHRTGGDLGHGHIGVNGLTVVDEQQGAVGDLNLLGLAFARGLNGQVEVHLSLLSIHTVRGT